MISFANFEFIFAIRDPKFDDKKAKNIPWNGPK